MSNEHSQAEQPNISQSHKPHSHSDSSTMEEKLPEQIMENVLLEGIDSTQFIENTDIVTFSNILANLRYDLSNILNEDVDEFQFQTICQDLLSKTSENIKIKAQTSNKSQSKQPNPIKNEINIDDVYAHLKRQPWHYNNYNINTTTATTAATATSTVGSSEWNSYIAQVCNHDKQNNISNCNESDEDENKKGQDDDCQSLSPSPTAMTLMGVGHNSANSNNEGVQFKNVPSCYQDIFNESELKKTTDDKSDDDDDALIVSNLNCNVTLMGYETIQ